MNILFFSHYFPPEGNAPASRVYDMARRWVADGHRVQVITCAPNVPNGVVYEGYRNRLTTEVVDGIQVTRVWTYLAPNKGTARRIANYLSYMVCAAWHGRGGERPDVVIATSPQFFCGWAGVFASRCPRVPFVLEIRDIWPESIVAVGAGLSAMSIRLLEWLEQRMYRAADHIVTVGEGYRERLLGRGVPAAKMTIVTNGVDSDLFSPRQRDAAFLARYGLAGHFVVGYVGTVGMACGLEVVLRAAERLKQQGDDRIRFLIVGDGAVKDDLEAAARAKGLDQVVFTGRLPKEDMPKVLASVDACLVHLRNTELFQTVLPSKIFEAAAMQRPIILGVGGQAAELLRQAQAGVCMTPDNEEELLSAVRDLAADPARARAMGESGHAFVLAHFNRDQLAQDYLRCLEAVIRGRRAAPASA